MKPPSCLALVLLLVALIPAGRVFAELSPAAGTVQEVERTLKEIPRALDLLQGFEENKDILVSAEIRAVALPDGILSIYLAGLSPEDKDAILVNRTAVSAMLDGFKTIQAQNGGLTAVRGARGTGSAGGAAPDIPYLTAVLLVPSLIGSSQHGAHKRALLEDDSHNMPLVIEDMIVSYAQSTLAYMQIREILMKDGALSLTRRVFQSSVYDSHEALLNYWSEGFISFQMSVSQSLKASGLLSIYDSAQDISRQNEQSTQETIDSMSDPEAKRLLSFYNEKGRDKPFAVADPAYVQKAKEFYRRQYIRLQKAPR
ncbi:MAG: hypothetical protein HY611_06250 [Elusimicrobia bacterium]|nr:hypothetical protein [Elusimicrobiota bacterium]